MERLLAIYLNDHLAGATGGRELARRTLANNRDTEYGRELQPLVVEIEEDLRTLEGLMERLGIARSPWKSRAAWAAEKLARGKLNGRLVGYSPLSRLEELEALESGVLAKRALWAALAEAAGALPGVDATQMRDLRGRADRQARKLENLRLRAAREALGQRA